MRVVFIGKSHEFSLAPLRALGEHHNIVGVVESAPRGFSLRTRSLLRAVFSSAKTSVIRRDSLQRIARSKRVPYLLLTRENRNDLARFVAATKPDIICVASLTQLLKRDVLEIPKYGAINLHPSLLPKYHGPYPWFWQYYAFENRWGMTVHFIDEGQDTGDIVKQEPFDLKIGTDIADAMKIAASIGARLMLQAVNEIQSETAVSKPQPPHSYPKARAVSRNEKLVDWDGWELERVWNFLRGTYPWLDAFEYPKGSNTLGTWKIGEAERGECDGTPGSVYKDSKGYFVAHREGKIRIHRTYSPNKLMKSIFCVFLET
jgi:methionyl-tRNA formyltransferase